MTFEEFKAMLKGRMQEYMGDGIEVRYETYTKNNQTEIEAMTFRERNPQEKTMLSPAIHLQDLYEFYKENDKTKEFDDCLHQIKLLYLNQEPKSFACIDCNWEEMQGSIFLSLVHEDWNQKWLAEQEIPYSKFLDFAIILRKTLNVFSHGAGTMVITKELMDYMSVSEDLFWEAAWNNLYQENFYIFEGAKLVSTESIEADMHIDLSHLPPMYIISNQDREYGSRAILRTDLLQKFSRELNCNLYILPSSIHEIILVADIGGFDVQKMRENVSSINASLVPEHERLSDEVYYFRKDRGTVEIAM